MKSFMCGCFKYVAVGVILCVNLTVYGADGIWLGAQDVEWINNANWGGGIYPSEADTASFSGSGNGNTAISVSGVSSLKNLLFISPNVASYALGTGGANAQTLVMAADNEYVVDASVVTDQTIYASLQMGSDISLSYHNIRNNSTLSTLNLIGDITMPTTGSPGYKYLQFYGDGTINLVGNYQRGARTTYLVSRCKDLTLAGSNLITRVHIYDNSGINITGYTKIDNQGYLAIAGYSGGGTFNGTGTLHIEPRATLGVAWLYVMAGSTLTFNVPIVCPGGLSSELNAAGIIELTADNQITGNIVYNAPATFSVAKIGNRGSTGNNLGQGDRLIFNAAGRLLYTGTGETTDRYLELNHNVTLEHAGTGTLIFSEAPIMGGLDKTLTLSAAADATGGLLGAIGDGSQTTSLSKEGDGLWFLSAANNYSGATIINGGTMLLNGVAGAITTTPSIAVTNGALRVENSAGANNADRINNSASISLNNSAIQFAHDAGAFSVGETLGVVTVAGGVNTISLEPAGAGQSAILMLGGLSHISGTLNFAGQGLGESNGCRIFIAGQSEGVIGNAATVNGTAVAAYSNARGVYALAESEYTAELAAQGPAPDSLIPDDPSALASITMPGTSGPMTLAADWTNSVGLLLQNSAYDAVVALRDGATNKTLRTSALQIADGKADLTLGQSAGDGVLMSLIDGGNLLLVNNSTDSALTVNADITDNNSPSIMVKQGEGDVVLAGAVEHTAPTWIGEGNLIFAGDTTQTLNSELLSSGTLKKQGGGTLALKGDNSDFDGIIAVSNGTLQVGHSNALGTSAAETFIADGATLDVGGSQIYNTIRITSETINVGGTGLNGQGAIISTSSEEQRHAFDDGAKVNLTGDTLVNAPTKRFGYWPASNHSDVALALNGYTLSKSGIAMFSVVDTAVDPGDDGGIDVLEGSFMLALATDLRGSETNCFTIHSAGTNQIFRLEYPVLWNLVMKDGAHLQVGNGTLPNNQWLGPVTLEGNANIIGNNRYYGLLLDGPISGSGGLTHVDSLTTWLNNTNNTYAGNTVIQGGVLNAAHSDSLPGYNIPGRVSVADGATLAVRTGDGVSSGWNRSQIDTLRGSAAFNVNAALGLDTTTGDWVYDANLSQSYILAKYGPNSLTLAGNTVVSSMLIAHEGTLNLAGAGAHSADWAYLDGSGTTMNIERPLTISNYGTLTVGAYSGSRCVLNINSDLNISSLDTSTRGRLRIGYDGADSAGAVIQSGGVASVSDAAAIGYSAGVSLGSYNGYGYYRMNGGTLNTWYMSIASESGSSNIGVFDLFDGSVNVNGIFLNIGHLGDMGVLNLFGGTFYVKSRIYITQSGNQNQIGILNLLSPAASIETSQSLEMAINTGNNASVVNLNAGELRVNHIAVDKIGTPTYFNFNGGTLRAKQTNPAFMCSKNYLTAATVYPGGAVIDSSTYNIGIAQNLQAPDGYGVGIIPLLDGGTGYIGAPAVKITGGSGVNATAIALVDLEPGSPSCGSVTNIMVTSPGFGYQAGDNLSVSLSGGGFLSAARIGKVVMTANSASGGLTKLGSGTLTLSGVNSYGGITALKEGTLKLANPKALPADSKIMLEGGTLDLNGYILTNAVGGTSGQLNNGTLTAIFSPAGVGAVGSDSFTQAGSALISGRYLADLTLGGDSDHMTFAGVDLSTIKLIINDPQQLDRTQEYIIGTRGEGCTEKLVLETELDERWHVVDGAQNSIKLIFRDGLRLIVR